MSLQNFEMPINVHFPQCQCRVGPVCDFELKEFKNATFVDGLFSIKTCRTRAPSPTKRTDLSLEKWRTLLILSGREVSAL